MHGFRVEGLGMVDFKCPTSEAAYERDLEAVAAFASQLQSGDE